MFTALNSPDMGLKTQSSFVYSFLISFSPLNGLFNSRLKVCVIVVKLVKRMVFAAAFVPLEVVVNLP